MSDYETFPDECFELLALLDKDNCPIIEVGTLSPVLHDAARMCARHGVANYNGRAVWINRRGHLLMAEHRLRSRHEDTPTPPAANVSDDSRLTESELAEKFNVPDELRPALRARLARWRPGHDDGWNEDANARSRGPRYLYRVGAVRSLVNALLLHDARDRASNARRKNTSRENA